MLRREWKATHRNERQNEWKFNTKKGLQSPLKPRNKNNATA